MKNMKIFTSSLLILFLSNVSVLSDITASAPTNIIQKIATASSFTSTAQSTAQNASQIQQTTNNVISAKEIKKTVQQDAKKFGLLINEAALSNLTGEESNETQLVAINAQENVLSGSTELKPNLDTIVYDTGLMTLAKEGGHYNNDNTKMKENEIYAIETFGVCVDNNSINNDLYSYMNKNDPFNTLYIIPENKKNSSNKIIKSLYQQFNTLPFSDNWIKKYSDVSLVKFKDNYKKLINNKLVKSFPPLYHRSNINISAQYEHTIFISEKKSINISIGNDY